MCSEDRPLKTQKLILEIDVTGNEADFARCEQLGEAFVALVTQMWWLAAPHIQFACSVKAKMMPQRVKKTHTDVALPQVKVNDVQTNHYVPLPKFQAGMRVRLNAESGDFQNLIKDFALVVSSKYVSNESWSGWTYKLTTKNLAKPIEIGEIWLELAPNTAEVKHKHSVSL